MADILCGYTADRDETLVAYLYGDIDESQRVAFAAHVETCERCHREMAELQGVRVRLRDWTAPQSVVPLGAVIAPAVRSESPGVNRPGAHALREVPGWAQVAAAMLFLGVSAGIANLDVHYDHSGLTVRTGWSRPVAPTRVDQASEPRSLAGQNTTSASPWRPDLDALEHRLRGDLHVSSSPGSATAAKDDRSGAASNADAQLLRKVRALLDDSERKQRNEMALQIAGVVQEFNSKRGSDLANIRTLKNVQSVTGVEIARQQQWLDVLTRASMQK